MSIEQMRLVDEHRKPALAQEHSDTSRAAAAQIEHRRPTLRARVLATLRQLGSATDEELQDALRMNPSTERPRRIELVEAGLVIDSGVRRRTRSNRQAVVWLAREGRHE